MKINTDKLSIRFILAGVFYWLFLKCYGLTPEQHWEEIYQQEKEFKQQSNLPL